MLLSFFKKNCNELQNNSPLLICTIFLILIALFSIIVPIISPYDYYTQDLNNTLLPPFTNGHIFGTDEFGRDLFTRVWVGSGISIIVGILAALIQTMLGSIYGGISGSIGGIVDEILMRITDIIYSIPNLIIIMLLTMWMGCNVFTIILALSITEWITIAKIIRTKTLELSEKEFVHAARLLGAGKIKILVKHILPNCFDLIIVNIVFAIPLAIFSEAFLSFIGLGVQVPRASLGSLVNDGYKYITSCPWLLFIPLAIIVITMIALNIVGDFIKERRCLQ